jgi:uncharacterized membrane protein YqaE (UPF0057 family)
MNGYYVEWDGKARVQEKVEPVSNIQVATIPLYASASFSTVPTRTDVSAPLTSVNPTTMPFLVEIKHEVRSTTHPTITNKRIVTTLPKKTGRSATGEGSAPIWVCVLLSFIFPPAAVGVFEGKITKHFWLCLLFTLLGIIPGIVYALVFIFTN